MAEFTYGLLVGIGALTLVLTFAEARWGLIGWDNFRLGYHAALDDVERTGLKPKTEATKESCARRAWRRLTGRRAPRRSQP